MQNYRRIYLDVSTGEFHAKFIGDNIKCYYLEDTFETGTISIAHNQNTTGVIAEIYDSNHKSVYMDNFEIIDANTVKFENIGTFSGFIKLIFFNFT